MKNELALFERPMTGQYFPYQIIPGGLSIIGMIVGFIMTIPPVFTGGPYVLIISSLVMILTIVGHHTHIARKFNDAHTKAWKSYKALPDSLRRNIQLDAKTLSEMDYHTSNSIRNSFDDLLETYNKRVLEESKANGKQRELFDAITSAMEHEENELKVAREVNDYMKELR